MISHYIMLNHANATHEDEEAWTRFQFGEDSCFVNEIILGPASSLTNLEPSANSPHRGKESVSSGLLGGVTSNAELLAEEASL